MKKLLIFLFLSSTSVSAQTINNATVNITGSTQNVSITQSSVGHSANLQLEGNGINVSVTQSGNTPQSFSLSVSCNSSCPSSPYIVNQY